MRQIFAWYSDPELPATLYWVAKKLSDLGIPTPRGGVRWNVASIRGILRSPAYPGMAYSGRTKPAPSRTRKSALQAVGPGQSTRRAPPQAWIGVPVPAIIDQETFDAAQRRLDQNKQLATRNNKSPDYLLRGLVSCGRCKLSSRARSLHGNYHYYACRGRTDALRAAKAERCTVAYAPAKALDDLVWQDLCAIIAEPAVIRHELQRARSGEWLPQLLQARVKALQDSLAQLERQQARLLEVYLAELISQDEFERKHKELTQTQTALKQQLHQLDIQAQQINTLRLTENIQAFCQRLQPTLASLSFVQRRQLLELLVDCVVVEDEKVEIRYVIPTSPKGETSRFCHLRLNYF